MRRHRSSLTVALFLILASASQASAASPPQLLNYQGVLRDANGLPLTGDYPMVFRLVERGAGDEILVDDHSGATGTGVPVVDGLFTVQIGSGVVSDGAGLGYYASLAEVFRDFNSVDLSIEVNGELLTPSIPIASAAYALNATHLDGLDQGRFLRTDVPGTANGNIWFSASPTGSTINDATALIKPITASPNSTLLGIAVSLSEKFRVDAEGDTFIGGMLNMPNGAFFWDSGSGLNLYGGDSDTDDVFIRAGNTDDDGAITIVGDGEIKLRAGNGQFVLHDSFDKGGKILASDPGVLLVGGAESTDHIQLQAGPSSNDGSITIFGNGDILLNAASDIELYSGDGEYRFTNPSPGSPSRMFGGSDSDLQVYAEGSQEMIIDYDYDSTEEFRWYTYVSIPAIYTGPIQIAELQQNGDFRIGGVYESNASFDLAESFLMMEPMEPGDVVSVDRSRGDAVRLAAGTGDPAVIGIVSTKPGMVLGGAPFEAESLRSVWGEELYEQFLQRSEKLEQQVVASRPGLKRKLDGASRARVEQPEGRSGPEELAGLQQEIRSSALELFCRERFAPIALAGRVPTKVDAGYGSIRVGDLLTTSPTPGHAMRADDPEPGTVIGKALEGLETGTGSILVLVTLR